MEFLTVDSPQDSVHLLRSMERDESPDLCDARSLIAFSNGGCSAGDRMTNIDPRAAVYPCQFARSPEFLVGNVVERPFPELRAAVSNPVLTRFPEKTGTVNQPLRVVPASGILRQGMPGAGIGSIRGFLPWRSSLFRTGRNGRTSPFFQLMKGYISRLNGGPDYRLLLRRTEI
jgi:hypothetical protein